MSVRRGTTPAHIFETNVDLTDAKVYVTYRQCGKTIFEKTNDDLEINKNVIIARLSQEETLSLKLGTVQIQIRYVMENGVADASDIMELDVDKILKEGVISYAD